MPERWLPAPDYERLYEVSDLGRVRSLHKRGRILRPGPKPSGHLTVSLYREGSSKSIAVHCLVMRAFVGPPGPGQEVRHLDGDPTNNHWAPGSEEETVAAGGNLFYGTRLQNAADMIRHGTSPRGERAGGAVLTVAAVTEIRRRHEAGELHTDIAEAFGVCRTVISHVVNGKSWASVPGATGNGRMRPQAQVRGERAGGARLTAELVLEIRRRYAEGETQVSLASAFGISRPTISEVARRATWTHLPDEQGEVIHLRPQRRPRKRETPGVLRGVEPLPVGVEDIWR